MLSEWHTLLINQVRVKQRERKRDREKFLSLVIENIKRMQKRNSFRINKDILKTILIPHTR